MNRAPWQNPTIISTLLVIFFVGVAAGAVAMKLTVSPERHRPGGTTWGGADKDVSLERFTRELNLSPDQAKEMETVLDDFMMYYQSLQAQMDDVRSTGNQRIIKILREDQRKKFEKMLGEIMSKQIR